MSVRRVEFFDPPKRPTGGTVYVRPASGNPYASIEDPDAIPVVDVHLPPYEEEES